MINFKCVRFTLEVYVSHKVNVLVFDIILNITSQEHLIFTSLHIGSRLLNSLAKKVRVKKQPGMPLRQFVSPPPPSPNTWFRSPFGDVLMLQLLRPVFLNLPCLFSTFHFEYHLIFLCEIQKKNTSVQSSDKNIDLKSNRTEKRIISDSVLWQKPLHPQKTPKSKVTTQ